MINNMDRGAKILIGALTIGILVIGLSQLITGSKSPDSKPASENSTETNYFNILNAKVDLLNSGPLDHNRFNSQEAEIDSYLGQQLIIPAAANSLKSSLNKIFAGRVYKECDSFLKGINVNSNQISQLLNVLQSKIGANATINGYKNQIKWYQYYSSTLPTKVNAFVRAGIDNYTETEYLSLKNEVQNTPGLNPAYSKSGKLQAAKNSMMTSLFQINSDFHNL